MSENSTPFEDYHDNDYAKEVFLDPLKLSMLKQQDELIKEILERHTDELIDPEKVTLAEVLKSRGAKIAEDFLKRVADQLKSPELDSLSVKDGSLVLHQALESVRVDYDQEVRKVFLSICSEFCKI